MSESLVVNHGDFLIRDSQSNQGNFVLTSKWQQQTLHFLVRKTMLQSGEACSRVQYSLEEGAFESLPALVHFYVGSRAPLTQWSGAQIQRPVNRTLPLRYLETAFGTVIGSPSCHGDVSCGQQKISQRRSDHSYNYVFKHLSTGGLHLWSQPADASRSIHGEGPSLAALIFNSVLYWPLLDCTAFTLVGTLKQKKRFMTRILFVQSRLYPQGGRRQQEPG